MQITCQRCDTAFEAPTFCGYCDGCKEHFANVRKKVHARQRPAPHVCADGKFAPEEDCPQSLLNPITNGLVCGLCGSNEISPGYGLGTGHGMGSYNFCEDCNSVLDFVEDTE